MTLIIIQAALIAIAVVSVVVLVCVIGDDRPSYKPRRRVRR